MGATIIDRSIHLFSDYTFRYRLPDDGLYIEEIFLCPYRFGTRTSLDDNQSLSERVTVRLTSRN